MGLLKSRRLSSPLFAALPNPHAPPGPRPRPRFSALLFFGRLHVAVESSRLLQVWRWGFARRSSSRSFMCAQLVEAAGWIGPWLWLILVRTPSLSFLSHFLCFGLVRIGVPCSLLLCFGVLRIGLYVQISKKGCRPCFSSSSLSSHISCSPSLCFGCCGLVCGYGCQAGVDSSSSLPLLQVASLRYNSHGNVLRNKLQSIPDFRSLRIIGINCKAFRISGHCALQVATESNENVEEENKEEAQVEPSEPKTKVAVVEVSEEKAENTKDTHNAEDSIEKTVEKVEAEKEEAKPDEKPSQS